MMQIADMCYIFRVILVQILFLNVINAEFTVDRNATKYDPIRTSERLKRAPTFHRSTPPSVLTATIIDGDEEIHLRWERVDRYLFNENLPVYTAQMNSWGATHKESNVMKDIGKTIIYHDIAKKSAIIYFEEQDAVSGVVGQSYEIWMIRVHELSRPLIVGEGFVQRLYNHCIHRKGNLKCKNYPRQKTDEKKEIDLGKTSASSVDNPDDTIPERFYIETLLFITYDVFTYARGVYADYDVVQFLIINYLENLNAVDMIFAMLPTNDFKLYINLAGIIIEEEDGVFSEILHYAPLRYDNQQELHNDGSLFGLFSHYPGHFDFPFAKDSFDLMLISTGRELHYNGYGHNAWDSPNKDIFLQRKSGNLDDSVPSIMVRSTDKFSAYPVVAHYIGAMLRLDDIRPRFIDVVNPNEVTCFSIMQRLQNYCTDCLKWGRRSITQLKNFFRENRNRCFYLNKPRSLYPAGTSVISVSPCRQCTCFGFHSYARESENECPFHIQPQDCGEPLLCNHQDDGRHQHSEETSILPFDGTPCGQNKVCWNEVCISLSGAKSESRV